MLSDARAYPPWIRLVAALLFAVSRASLPAILALLFLAVNPPLTPLVLVRLVVMWAVLPGLAAWVLRRGLALRAGMRAGELLLARRALRVEVPCDAIAAVVPWTVPLPGPGFSLRLRSGRRRFGIEASDPTPLLRALAEDCGVVAAARSVEHPTLVYARARRTVGTRRWFHLLGRFPLFALLPTALLFNVHQHIAYGALLGEYYLRGLRSWLTTLAVYWGTLTIQLVLYASLWRGLTEIVSLAAAWVAPSHAARVRRAAEATAQVLYYGGVPALLLIRFLY